MAAETAAELLHALYVDELRQSLVPPGRPMVNRRQTEALIRRAQTIGCSGGPPSVGEERPAVRLPPARVRS